MVVRFSEMNFVNLVSFNEFHATNFLSDCFENFVDKTQLYSEGYIDSIS